MTGQEISGHMPAFMAKMEQEGLPSIVVDTFAWYYQKVLSGESGRISDREIKPLAPEEIPDMKELESYGEKGRNVFSSAVRIILNGGLGTGMGLTGPKSLLPVRKGLSFLEILLRRSAEPHAASALMNSFSTHGDTLKALDSICPEKPPLCFLQHKFPKILQADFSPAICPEEPDMEWNPPGHGDIYTALETSGMLDRLLDQGIVYAFISNSDNLGATMNESLLGYFSEKNLPFMMEVARRTPADIKGGHLARHQNGYLLLRESAQCPEEELNAFQDINRYHFFNTNNLWINLKYLKSLIEKEKTVRLPMILNPKKLKPRDESSPAVFQVETAMGAAISLFEGAAAVRVPRSRFFPVKKCSDLLLVRSDYFLFNDDGRLLLNPERTSDNVSIRLDSRYYGKIDDFDRRFPAGVPSMKDCESLTVEGDVFFEADVRLRGHVMIRNTAPHAKTIPGGTRIEGRWDFPG